ncbi:hypothetical protein GGI20_003569 [Coemansia sp. BCRC 34301]|nr:hypothetical protein GGI20_003569 [Coemansia sp. BCRC 34301]
MTEITENSQTIVATLADEVVAVQLAETKDGAVKDDVKVETEKSSEVTEKSSEADTVAEAVVEENPEEEKDAETIAVTAVPEESQKQESPAVDAEATTSEKAKEQEPAQQQRASGASGDGLPEDSVREPVDNGDDDDDDNDNNDEQPAPGKDILGKEAEEIEIERPRVQVYGSTVSGNRIYKRQAKELFTMLEAQEVDFEFICIAADEKAKKYLRRKALGNMTIPQVYVDGELRGFYEDAFKANEADELYEWLGLDEEPIDC